VLQARGDSAEASAALGELCDAYYSPVFAFVRRNALDEESARELTQDFFATLLAGHGIGSVDPRKGRFRSFLLGAAKHFLSNARNHARRLKRGKGQILEPLEMGTDTSPGSQWCDNKALSPDREFDRKWALTLLGRAMTALEEDNKASGKAAQFETLKPWLTGEMEELSQADAARQLGLSEGAVKVAIHRLRRRFRDLVKAEIRQTLHNPSEVVDELSCLLAALGA
jgi:RNA polymerase sigma-70 factor (ECF subfamily)